MNTALSLIRGREYRAGMFIAAGTAAFLLVANGALGIIGSENNNANRLYLGVIAIGIVGALVVRFRPRGMIRVLIATAIAQALVPVVALGMIGVPGPVSVFDVIMLTTFFVGLWLGAAWLFRMADRRGGAPSAA